MTTLIFLTTLSRVVKASTTSIIGPIIDFQLNETTQNILILLCLVLISALFKVMFSNIPSRVQVHKYLPESAIVILLGIVLGLVILTLQNVFHFGKNNPLLSFNGDVFFVSSILVF